MALLVSSCICLGLVLIGCAGDDDDAGSAGVVRPGRTALETTRSLELTRSLPAGVRPICRAAARQRVDVPVICPRLVPDVRIVRDPDLTEAIVYFDDPRFYELTFNNGFIPGTVHWVVGVGCKASVTDNVLSDKYNEIKGPPEHIGRESARVELYWWPRPLGAVHEGHVVAAIQVEGMLVYASVHGRSRVDTATAMARDLARVLGRRLARDRAGDACA